MLPFFLSVTFSDMLKSTVPAVLRPEYINQHMSPESDSNSRYHCVDNYNHILMMNILWL
jgi:hypothetical protein